MPTLTKDEIVEAIKSMSVLDLSELSKTLQDVFGVSAAAPVGYAAPPPGGGGGGGAVAEVVEEVTSFDVVLTAAGDKRLGVIKVVREITGLGLKKSKDMVEAVPSKIKQGVNQDEAKSLKEKLEAEGATIEIKPSS